MPDGTPCKTIYDLKTHPGCCFTCFDYLLGSPLIYSGGIAITPDIFRKNTLMALIDAVTEQEEETPALLMAS